MHYRRRAVMRLLGVLVLAVVMYFAVPLLWERAIVYKVNELAERQSPIPIGNVIAPIDAGNMAAAINPPVLIDTKKYEQIAIQSQIDQQMRQTQQAQDQARQATHPNIP